MDVEKLLRGIIYNKFIEIRVVCKRVEPVTFFNVFYTFVVKYVVLFFSGSHIIHCFQRFP
jgi:hypothetical protein